jgi:hypothetical protein
MRVRFGLNPESERISRSLTSTSSIRPELMAEGSRVAAGLASVSENGKLPYGRRFPAECCRDLQFGAFYFAV